MVPKEFLTGMKILMGPGWYRSAPLQLTAASIAAFSAERHEHHILPWELILHPLRAVSLCRVQWDSHCLGYHKESNCKALFIAGCTVVIPINNTDYAVCYECFPQLRHLMSVLLAVCSIIELNCGV